MQPFSVTDESGVYDLAAMQIGRPSKNPRTPFGERLNTARTALGISQSEMAEKLGISQTSYADWERYPVALRPDQVQQLIEILGVTADDLYGAGTAAAKRRGGPTGKARQVFEAVSKLPRSQQAKVIEMAEGFLSLHGKTS
jgi:transcriptional regulator with XRE-family HTH domain